MQDLKLFPKKEEWGTGDEAMDNKLSMALNDCITNLSFESISQFYSFATSLKPRAFNPYFFTTVELTTKALFYVLDSNSFIDHQMKKMRGEYYSKEKIHFSFEASSQIISELKISKKIRYQDQVDFSLQSQNPIERNPYVIGDLLRSRIDLSIKIIFKDFKSYLNNEESSITANDSFFLALRGGQKVLRIEDFAEIWFSRDQIYAIAHGETF